MNCMATGGAKGRGVIGARLLLLGAVVSCGGATSGGDDNPDLGDLNRHGYGASGGSAAGGRSPRPSGPMQGEAGSVSAGGGSFGGAPSTGGAANAGGSVTTGGGISVGGAISVGGSIGVGGRPGVGGAFGFAGAAGGCFTFEGDTEGWRVQYTAAMEGIAAVAPAEVRLDWTPDASGGALRATIPYTSRGQFVGIGVPQASPLDLRGRRIVARVRVASGLGDPSDLLISPGGAKLYAKTGQGFVYGNGPYYNLSEVGSEVRLSYDPTNPDFVDESNPLGPFDPRTVLELGIQFDTGTMASSATTAVIFIDDVCF